MAVWIFIVYVLLGQAVRVRVKKHRNETSSDLPLFRTLGGEIVDVDLNLETVKEIKQSIAAKTGWQHVRLVHGSNFLDDNVSKKHLDLFSDEVIVYFDPPLAQQVRSALDLEDEKAWTDILSKAKMDINLFRIVQMETRKRFEQYRNLDPVNESMHERPKFVTQAFEGLLSIKTMHERIQEAFADKENLIEDIEGILADAENKCKNHPGGLSGGAEEFEHALDPIYAACKNLATHYPEHQRVARCASYKASYSYSHLFLTDGWVPPEIIAGIEKDC